MKISKNIWLSVLIGVLVICGISLGMALNLQSTQKANVEKNLMLAKQRLSALDDEKLIAQKDQLVLQLSQYSERTADIKSKLTFSDDNILITDKIIHHAKDCKVDLLEISSPGSAVETVNGLQYKIMNLVVRVQGVNETVAEFVYSLKKVFPTGVVKSLTLDFVQTGNDPAPLPAGDNYTAMSNTGSPIEQAPVKNTIANINITIYNYQGE